MIWILIILSIVITHAGIYIFGYHGGFRRGSTEGQRTALEETRRLSRYLEQRAANQ